MHLSNIIIYLDYPSIYPSFHESIYFTTIYPSIYLSFKDISINLSVHHQFINTSIQLTFHQSIYLPTYLSYQGWPWSAPRGMGGEGSYWWKNFLCWTRHQAHMISTKGGWCLLLNMPIWRTNSLHKSCPRFSFGLMRVISKILLEQKKNFKMIHKYIKGVRQKLSFQVLSNN